MRPLLSIAIPTHNRARYAIPAIESILAIADNRLELVVSDTSTDGELAAHIASGTSQWRSDPRLVYQHHTVRLDMTGNHNAAIGATTGHYVCLIGDDDTISSDALDAAEWALQRQIEIIAPNVVANYVWPDFRSKLMGNKHAARLYLARRMGDWTVQDCDKAFKLALSNAAQGTDGLPKIYHGIVAREVLQRLQDKTGAFFHGSSPDVSGAVGLSLCARRFVVMDFPLTIPGASGGSNTGRSAMNTHKGTLKSEVQTKHFEDRGWSEGVPKFFSVETVWAHAALETIRGIAPDQLHEFNYARLLGLCKVLHPEFEQEIADASLQVQALLGISAETLQAQIRTQGAQYRKERRWKLIKRLLRPTAAGGRAYVGNLATVSEAPAALKNHLAKEDFSWQRMERKLSTIEHTR